MIFNNDSCSLRNYLIGKFFKSSRIENCEDARKRNLIKHYMMENMPKTKRKRLSADFYLVPHGCWGGLVNPKQDHSYWKFPNYRGTN